MAKLLFKGIQVVTALPTNPDKQILYFVRINEDKTDGYIYFNGKKYGTGVEVLEDAENYADSAITMAIESLDVAAIGGDEGKFIKLVSEANGLISAQTEEFVTKINNDSKNSLIAPTTKAVYDLVSELNGALRLIAVLPVAASGETFEEALAIYKAANTGYTEEVGDVFLHGTKEYVYADGKWNELGDESTAAKLIAELNSVVTGESKEFSVTITEESGLLTEVTLVVPDFVINNITAETANGKVEVTIDSEDILLGKDVIYGEGDSAITIATTAETITEGFEAVVEKMVDNEKVTAAALNDLDERVDELEAKSSEAVSNDGSINISASTVGDETVTNFEVNKETVSDDTVAEGHAALVQNANDELYVEMYFSGDDVE